MIILIIHNKKKNNHEKYITYILKIISYNYNVEKFKENLIIIRITEKKIINEILVC